MRLFISVILIGVLAGIATWLLPWWLIAPVSFAVALLLQLRPGAAFIAGFLGVGLLWLIVSLTADSRNNHLLSGRMAQVFSLPGSVSFIAVSVVIGAVAGGLAGLSAALLRAAFMRSRQAI